MFFWITVLLSWKIVTLVDNITKKTDVIYNCRTNDIYLCFHNYNLLSFADDMNIYSKITSVEDVLALQNDLKCLDEYYQLNKLDLNLAKCSMIIFCRKRTPLLYRSELKGQVLQRCDGVSDLSVYYNTKL